MGTLCYTASVSLDGYVADADGDFQWSAPDDEVFNFHVERMGPVSHEVLGCLTMSVSNWTSSSTACSVRRRTSTTAPRPEASVRSVVVPSLSATCTDLNAAHISTRATLLAHCGVYRDG